MLETSRLATRRILPKALQAGGLAADGICARRAFPETEIQGDAAPASGRAYYRQKNLRQGKFSERNMPPAIPPDPSADNLSQSSVSLFPRFVVRSLARRYVVLSLPAP